MENDIFPNPVVRNDLPVRRRRWPKVVLILGIFGVLVIAFLPQILGTSIGRKFAVTYIARKTHSSVVLESMKTSWFGGTTFRQLWIKDPLNRRMGCRALTCKASLLDLLRGKWSLGDATVEGAYIDYVIDNGRGADSFDQMRGATEGSFGKLNGRPLWPLSGNIKIANGTLVLWRGTIQPKLYDTTWEGVRFVDVNGTVNIASMDKPWTFDLKGTQFDENQPAGTIAATGTASLGAAGRFDAQQMTFDVKLSGKNLYPAQIFGTFIPGSTASELRTATGDLLESLDVAATAADGKIKFSRCEASGPVMKFGLKPTIDVTGTGSKLTVSGGQNSVTTGLCRSLSTRLLAQIHPFLREAVPGQGQATLSFEELSMPLGSSWTRMTARGAVSARGKLARLDEIGKGESLPQNLASQVALLTGDSEQMVQFEANGRFVIGESQVALPPMTTRVGQVDLHLRGVTSLETGQITMLAEFVPGAGLRAGIPSMKEPIIIPLGGTIQQPSLGVLSPRGSLSEETKRELEEQVNKQTGRMQETVAVRLRQKSQDTVNEILRSLQGPGTGPATRP